MFFDEAEKIWQEDKECDSLTTLQAMTLLGSYCMCNGKDQFGLELCAVAAKMAQRLQLFGVESLDLNSEPSSRISANGLRASAQTAWGAFNFLWQVCSVEIPN